MPPWPFNDPFASVAMILLIASAIGWLDDKIEAFKARRVRRARGDK